MRSTQKLKIVFVGDHLSRTSSQISDLILRFLLHLDVISGEGFRLPYDFTSVVRSPLASCSVVGAWMSETIEGKRQEPSMLRKAFLRGLLSLFF